MSVTEKIPIKLIAVLGALSLAGGMGAYWAGSGPAETSAPELEIVTPLPGPAGSAIPDEVDAPLTVIEIESEPPPQDGPVSSPEAARALISAEIRGAVRSPGAYELHAGDRVQHLIDRARGLTDAADLDDINIAARLIDGSVLVIPERPVRGTVGDTLVYKRTPTAAEVNPPEYTRSGWRPPPTAPAAVPAATAGKEAPSSENGLLDLNTATQEDLESLPGIGPVMAGRIIAYRTETPYYSVDELLNVHGIGEARLNAIRHLVTIQ